MQPRCEICGLTNLGLRMALVQVAEVIDGRVSWCQKEVCARCVARYAVLMPNTTIRDMVASAVSRMHEVVLRTLIDREMSNATTQK